MSDIHSDVVLAHYGVLGMKWGVRKDRSSVRTGRQKESSDDFKKKTELNKKIKSGGTKSLSNQELRQVMERMQLEAAYKGLDSRSKTSGEDRVKKILAVSGTVSAVIALGNSPVGKAIKTIADKAIRLGVQQLVVK